MEKKWYVYLISENGVVRYVGKTDNFNTRKKQHLEQGRYSSVPKDVDIETVDIQVVRVFNNNVEACECEGNLITEYHTLKREGLGGWNINRGGLVTKQENWCSEYYKERNQKPERKEWTRKYAKSDKYKDWLHKYRTTDKYREYNRLKQRERRKMLKEQGTPK